VPLRPLTARWEPDALPFLPPCFLHHCRDHALHDAGLLARPQPIGLSSRSRTHDRASGVEPRPDRGWRVGKRNWPRSEPGSEFGREILGAATSDIRFQQHPPAHQCGMPSTVRPLLVLAIVLPYHRTRPKPTRGGGWAR
jgi:hypothetical protein